MSAGKASAGKASAPLTPEQVAREIRTGRVAWIQDVLRRLAQGGGR